VKDVCSLNVRRIIVTSAMMVIILNKMADSLPKFLTMPLFWRACCLKRVNLGAGIRGIIISAMHFFDVSVS
jgi:hypothetical protein